MGSYLWLMAFGAAQRQAEPDLAERVGAIDIVADDELLRIGAALLVEAGVAVEAARRFSDPAVGARQQVAGELLDGELVEGHVAC